MMTYIIEIAAVGDTFWTLEKCRAESQEAALAELSESYGADALIGYIKAVY